MSPELIKALMRWQPEYFSWGNEKQEMFHLKKPEDISQKIYNSLLKSIFNVSVPITETNAAIDDLSIDQMYHLNRVLLPIQGIGSDTFFLNESFKENTTLKDFKTLYDYDYDDFLFQEKWRKKDIEEFLMVGNSLKSDILPLVELGANAIHVPFHTTWQHEEVSHKEVDNDSYTTLKNIRQVLLRL